MNAMYKYHGSRPGENMMPLGYWTLISREPFRLLISMIVLNHTLTLFEIIHERAIHRRTHGLHCDHNRHGL